MTAVVVTYGYNRLFSLRQLLYRWRGWLLRVSLTHSPMLLAVQVPSQSQAMVLQFLNTHHLPSRLTILLYITARASARSAAFQINTLRNLALFNLRTTHFIVMDVDTRVSSRGDLWNVRNSQHLQRVPESPRFCVREQHQRRHSPPLLPRRVCHAEALRVCRDLRVAVSARDCCDA